MYYIISAVVIALVLYWLLQSHEDTKARRENKEVASTGKRIALFFFLLVVSIFLSFFIGNAWKGNGQTGGTPTLDDYKIEPNYKAGMVKAIPEDIQVGLPPFASYLEH
jgi:hypothetical protein